MTNAEKYKEVFGMPVPFGICPTQFCNDCPCLIEDSNGYIPCGGTRTYEWWNKEYKENKR